MFASADMSKSTLDATIKPAQAYDAASGRYADHDDPLASWLTLEAGADTVSLRLTWPQLDALHAVLDALLTDRSVSCGGGPIRGEQLPDRDPTQPVPETPASDTIVWTIHGWRVTLRRWQNGAIAVQSIDGMTARDLRDYPTWPNLAAACNWLYETLELRPATVQG